MKKTIFAAAMALCLLAATSTVAQNAQPREKMTAEQIAQKRADRMTETLKLDQKQSKQIYDYTLEQVKQMQNRRAEMMQNRKAANEKMKAILTPEQYTQWEQMQDSKPCQRMRHGKAGMRGKSCDKPCKAECKQSCDKPCKAECKQNCDKPCKAECKQNCDKPKCCKSTQKAKK